MGFGRWGGGSRPVVLPLGLRFSRSVRYGHRRCSSRASCLGSVDPRADWSLGPAGSESETCPGPFAEAPVGGCTVQAETSGGSMRRILPRLRAYPNAEPGDNVAPPIPRTSSGRYRLGAGASLVLALFIGFLTFAPG